MRSTLALALAALANMPVQAVSTFSPARPPAIPLAVRSPYLNTWLNGDPNSPEDGYLPGRWPVFWTQSITGWQGFIRVDGTTYNWMGGAPGPGLVNQTAFSYTSTQSDFVMNVGGVVEMNIKFLSPVYPNDLQRQAATHSYLDVRVKSLDGAAHDVQLYADAAAEFASGDKGAVVEWEAGSMDGVRYHKFYRRDQRVFSESNDQADWGNWYLASADNSGLTWQSGADVDVRGNFIRDGRLPNSHDGGFRPVNDRWPVFGFARDFGTVHRDEVHNLFTIGYAQGKAIRFQGNGDQPQEVPSLWTASTDELHMLTSFYLDYDRALRDSNALDRQVSDASVAMGGQDYLTVTSLAVRQTFGALQFTGSPDAPLVFLKEISSNSDIQTVDVIFPAFPLLLYMNPDLLKYCLEPLLENQESGHYPRKSAIHDLGRFPNALGYPDGNDEPMPLEESGNMIIMMLAYTQRTGDVDYLKKHWNVLKNWAGYLIDDAKIPAEQLSTDDFAGHLANQTNLALKGIIALKAMAEVSRLADQPRTTETYDSLADSYLQFWLHHGVNKDANPPHTNLQYDNAESHGLLYNLYADRLLRLNFVPQSVYKMQSDYYPTIATEWGVALDTRRNWTKADWEMFAAAVASVETRQMFIQRLAHWIDKTSTHRAMTDLYDIDTGGYPGLEFTARPVMGGVFAPLALVI